MADTQLGPDAAQDRTDGPDQAGRKIGEGPGRLLVSLYALFTLAAGGRSIYQLIAQFHHAPLSYILSAVAATIYAVILVTLVRGGRSARRLALAGCVVELVGVLTVGTLTIVLPSAFPDQTVWSYYGLGYLFIPLALPVSGILWLRRADRQPGAVTAAVAAQP
ncbi:hypothetical protein [Streptacidiphilus sp. PAMC 29251]